MAASIVNAKAQESCIFKAQLNFILVLVCILALANFIDLTDITDLIIIFKFPYIWANRPNN